MWKIKRKDKDKNNDDNDDDNNNDDDVDNGTSLWESPSKKKIGHNYSSSDNISEVYNISNSSNNITEVDADTAAVAAVADDNDNDNGLGLSCVRVFTKATVKRKRKHTDKGYTKEQKERWYKIFKQLVKYKNHVCSCSHQV
mmetsp:Transcript_49195/g.49956  ORF Transcript_49195/g.49956 Transcript_49195/m.49956 type:complete len:141 (-) Transcript_49195:171-593(-)